jgi:ATP-dependent Clp protease ATP-binding subunit ClpC
MFERFTDGARKTIVAAQDQARELGHHYIGTEHVLLALLDDGNVRGMITNLDRDPEEIFISLHARMEMGSSTIPSGHIPFTPKAKKVLEFSLREAIQAGKTYIGTEHVFLALIREGEGMAAQTLIEEGIDLLSARLEAAKISPNRPAQPERPVEEVRVDATTRLTSVALMLMDAAQDTLRSQLQGDPVEDDSRVIVAAIAELSQILAQKR